MKRLHVLLTLFLTLTAGIAFAAQPTAYKAGPGVAISSDGGLNFVYMFGHNNSNEVAVGAKYNAEDFQYNSGNSSTFNNDNEHLWAAIGYQHFFSTAINKLFWGLGADYARNFGKLKVSGTGNVDNESWFTSGIFSFQYRLKSNFYLGAGVEVYTFGEHKFKNQNTDVKISQGFNSGYASMTYLF